MALCYKKYIVTYRFIANRNELTFNMENKQLLFFRKAAELEHMTKAAEILHISQPFLSSTISELEAELGVKLFDHAGRGIVLNEYGKAFYKHVVKIYNEADSAVRELRDMQNKSTHTLKIATNTGLYMPDLLRNIKKKMPDLQIRMRTAKRNTMIRQLTNGSVDFIICGPHISDNPDIESEILMVERGTIIHHKDHWLKDHAQFSLKALENEAFIAASPGYAISDSINQPLASIDMKPNVIIETTDTTSTLAFVKSGVGIAIAPLSVVMRDEYFRYCHVQPNDVELQSSIGISWRKEQYLSKTSKEFIQIAKNYFFEQYKQFA